MYTSQLALKKVSAIKDPAPFLTYKPKSFFLWAQMTLRMGDNTDEMGLITLRFITGLMR